MPPPDEPRIPSATGGLSAEDAAAADPDYLYFLRYLHLDGDAYTLVIPSKDGDSAPPEVIRYEHPLPDHNAAGTPAAGSECGGQKAPPQSPEKSGATSEAPHGVKRKAPDASPGGEGRSGAVPMEKDTPTPVPEPWYESQPGMDEDYLFFLRHLSLANDKLVLKTPGYRKITIGDISDPEENDDTEEEEEEEEEEDEEEEGGEDDEVDGLASGQSGDDGIGMEEKDDEEEAIPASDTEHGVDPDLPIPKVKEEEVSNKEGEDDVGPGADLQIVNDPAYYETKKVKEEVEEPLNALASGTKDLDPLDKKEASSSKGLLATPLSALTKVKEEVEEPLNTLVSRTTDLDPSNKKEANSSKGHLATPLNASELQGVIWPPHINERPNTVFKEKLIEFLKKPFTQEEYDRYLFLATDRTPMVKERRTRNTVAYYSWTHEMGKSYFDRYPDLAEQFSLQCNNHPNGLALLRGLFFWLQNTVLEDQFRPWSDEFKRYRVLPYMEME